MHYVRIYADNDGRSAFEDVAVEGTPTAVVKGLPPLLVSGPFPVSDIIFVEQPSDDPDWESHVAPRRQWIVCLQGRVSVTVSSGDQREFGPGGVLLVEDTEGEGHISTPLTADLTFAMIPVAT